MSSASSVSSSSTTGATAAPTLRWRRWPLADHLPRSLLVPLAVVGIAVAISYVAGSGWMGLFAAAAMFAALASFFLPVRYEIHAGGFHCSMLGRSQFVPWHANGSYEPRTTGILLFDRTESIPLDVVKAQFLPYGDDPDELLCVVRQYAPHAEEVSG
jgi:hypothetical protein